MTAEALTAAYVLEHAMNGGLALKYRSQGERECLRQAILRIARASGMRIMTATDGRSAGTLRARVRRVPMCECGHERAVHVSSGCPECWRCVWSPRRPFTQDEAGDIRAAAELAARARLMVEQIGSEVIAGPLSLAGHGSARPCPA